MVPRGTWSFEDAVRAAWHQYIGGGIESRGRRNVLLRIWAGLAGPEHAVASLDKFIADYGGIEGAAEGAGLRPSTLRHLRREFAALPEAAGPHYSPQLTPEDILRGANSSYIVETVLGRGGTARVYRVRLKDTGQPFAAKLLSTDRFEVTAAVRQRFVREATIARSFSHPNVVRTREVLVHRTELVSIMELLDGRNVAELIRKKGRPSLATGLRWIEGLMAGTSYLHENEIVHRDISPKNLFLRSDLVTAIGDYGIARRTSDETITAEEHRRMMGNVIYISPQQRNDPHAATFHDDVYAIGQVAFYILTGEEPHGTTVAPVELVPELPGRLSSFVDRLRSRLARDRPRDAIEAYAELREVLPGLPRPRDTKSRTRRAGRARR